MKKAVLALGLAAVAFGAQAQKSNAIKVNILSPLVKTGSFFYERKITENKSAQLGVGFTSWGKADATKLSGIFITPEFRFYLNGEALNGFYVAPFLRYQNLKVTTKSSDFSGNASESKGTLNTFGGGVMAGRQWMLGDIVTLDLFIGPSYNVGDVKYESSNGDADIPASFSGFGVRTGITLGIAF
ncbi:MAG: DUF3575 domain-containing protein [Chitinophagaceae bacterium]|nr:MAG: DUF3575 domain-containing protein [Chitinophagaceae bacterium]